MHPVAASLPAARGVFYAHPRWRLHVEFAEVWRALTRRRFDPRFWRLDAERLVQRVKIGRKRRLGQRKPDFREAIVPGPAGMRKPRRRSGAIARMQKSGWVVAGGQGQDRPGYRLPWIGFLSPA